MSDENQKCNKEVEAEDELRAKFGPQYTELSKEIMAKTGAKAIAIAAVHEDAGLIIMNMQGNLLDYVKLGGALAGGAS